LSYNVWNVIGGNAVVVATREVGRARMYKLNKKNPIVKKFMELDDAISDHCAPRVRDEMLVIVWDSYRSQTNRHAILNYSHV